MFQGSMVALVTPMTPTGAIDEACIPQLIERHIQAGTSAIVILGTTGEAPTITHDERTKIITTAVQASAGRIPIIVGTGTYSTMETIVLTEQAKELGASACLVVVPYYSRPTQEGVYQHFRSISEAVGIPLILYNHPKRTGCDLLPETVDRLAEFFNIVGIKDSSCDLARGRELVAVCAGRLGLYTGDDASSLAFMLQGGKGVISVTANVAPKQMQDMCAAALAGDFELAGQLNTQLMPLHKNLAVESNPIPVKWALNQLGWIQEGIRLPLTPLSPEYHEDLREAMKISGVI